jgi:hypothetical protein
MVRAPSSLRLLRCAAADRVGKRGRTRVDGLEIPAILDRVIIGPTQYPIPMVTAFTDALRKAGVPNPESRVFLSNIPLRT